MTSSAIRKASFNGICIEALDQTVSLSHNRIMERQQEGARRKRERSGVFLPFWREKTDEKRGSILSDTPHRRFIRETNETAGCPSRAGGTPFAWRSCCGMKASTSSLPAAMRGPWKLPEGETTRQARERAIPVIKKLLSDHEGRGEMWRGFHGTENVETGEVSRTMNHQEKPPVLLALKTANPEADLFYRSIGFSAGAYTENSSHYLVLGGNERHDDFI